MTDQHLGTKVADALRELTGATLLLGNVQNSSLGGAMQGYAPKHVYLTVGGNPAQVQAVKNLVTGKDKPESEKKLRDKVRESVRLEFPTNESGYSHHYYLLGNDMDVVVCIPKYE